MTEPDHQIPLTPDLSAPECADLVERDWSDLPDHLLQALAFEVLDRAVRISLARCFAKSGRDATAKLLTQSPTIDGASAWRRALAVMREECAIDPANDPEMDALSAYCCLAGNLPAAILEQPAAHLLREASVGGFILCNFATGSFSNEMQAQRAAVAQAVTSS